MLMFDKVNLEHASPGGWMEEAYRFSLRKCRIPTTNSPASLQPLDIN